MKYAAGKRAWGICDRSGLRYPLKDLVPQYRNGVKTGLLVGRDQVDEDHPQNFIGRARTDDAQALRNPRPETTNGREIDRRVSYLQGVTATVSQGDIGLIIYTDASASISGMDVAMAMGEAAVAADQIFSVTGAQIDSATQSVGAEGSAVASPAGMVVASSVGSVGVSGSGSVAPDGFSISAAQGSISAHVDAVASPTGMGISASMGGAVAGVEVLYNTSAVTGGGYLGFGLMLNGSYVDTGTTFRGPAITVVRGNTYKFQHGSSDLYNNYRLFISTTNDGLWGGGSQYTAGWTEDGGNLTRIWTVPASAPDTMYYYSPDGPTAGNTITVTD